MNILFFISTLNYGGAEKQTILDANMIVRENKVFLFYFIDGPQKEILDKRVNLIQLKKKNYFISAINLAKLVKQYNIQLIHSSLYASNIISAICSLFCKAKVIWHFHSHEYELPWMHCMALKWLPRLTNLKKICFVNRELIQSFQERGFNFPINKIKLLYNSATIPPSGKMKKKNNKILIGYTGRVVSLKRVDYLIELAQYLINKRFTDFQIQIVGDGDKRIHLEQESSKKGLQRFISFVGFQVDVDKYYKGFDLLVNPSQEECLSLSLIEGGMYGISSVAFDVGGNDEIVLNSITGYLVKTKDEFFEKVLFLIINKTLRQEMGKNAVKHCIKQFSEERHLQNLESLYGEVMRMNKPLKTNILYITSGLKSGGKERQLIELMNNFDKNNYKIGVVSFGKKDHYSFIAKENSSYFHELIKRPTRLEPFFTIWKCFRDFRPEIVHTWDSLSSMYAWLPCKYYKIKLIDGSIRDSGIDKGINYYFKRFFLKRADVIISNSYAGLKAYKIDGQVIYNAIDEKRFLPRNAQHNCNMIMVAGFSDFKDQQTFIKAAVTLLRSNEIDNVYLLGNGPRRLSYINQIKREYPDMKERILFPGSVHNVEDYLAKCDFGVLCSTKKYSEGISNSVLEYMAAGLIPIVTDLGGSPEIIENGINGFLIQPEDDEAIVSIVRRIKKDQSLRRQIVANARQTITDKFSIHKNMKALATHYI